MRYMIKLWTDYYNEQNNYKLTIIHSNKLSEAKEYANSLEYERSLVLDTFKNIDSGLGYKMVYHRGF